MRAAGNFGWDSLRHGGLLLDPQRVARISDHAPPPLPSHLEQELRRRAGGVLEDSHGSAEISEFVAFVLERICGFSPETGIWQRGPQVGSDWTRRAVTGEAVRPRQLWRGREAGAMPVFLDSEPRLGQGRGRRTVSHVHQWLRSGAERLALLTNGRQWRLVFAGLDFDAWCEWDIDLWFEQGVLSPQVVALRTLLAPALWVPPSKGDPAPLLQAVLDSRKGQAELSAVLGERVREAVEKLVWAHSDIIKEKCSGIEPADIYRAAVRVVMRLVVALFAESRDLLPRGVPIYHECYGAAGLLEELEKAAARGGDRLARSWGAWPRVLALFRIIHAGSHHEALSVTAYGGELFAPGDADAPDGLSRALAVFESACFDREVMSDRDVYDLLNLLTRTRIRVRQGRAGTWITAPVDFSDLSSEYIGILYEGLLDFELKIAEEGDPIIFLAVGQEPALPLSRLEKMDERALASLLEKMKDTAREGEGEDAGENGETPDELSEEDRPGAEEQGGEGDEPAAGPCADVPEPSGLESNDERRKVRTRAETWARNAVVAAKLVPKPRGALTPEKRQAHDQAVGRMAARLVSRVVLPGEHYLIRWGGTRKGAGTFYTRPGLAVPTVHRTLRPLAYDPPLGGDGKPDFAAPPSAWTPKKPEEILALKVCDPACGSGTFPVAALRFLTEAVYEALHFHKRLDGDFSRPIDEILGLAPAGIPESIRAFRLPCRPGDDDFEKKTKAAIRRYVVERSVYGVDIDPLAVELCRLSLWIETMDRSLPFSFLDHKIKCGNSLVGAWFDQFRHYPVMAWKNREAGDKSHTNGVHFGKETRTRAIKVFVKDRLAPDLVGFLSDFALFPEGLLEKAESAHEEALSVFSRLHEFPVHESAERARVYQEKFLDSEAYCSLKAAMDLWCACWFWPADDLDKAPLPTAFFSPSPETLAVAAGIARKKRFFHWELEFPDVFRAAGSGFDAMLGNPPWDIAKPNSKEFFSNTDPLYRSYGKQEALRFQAEYFKDERIERKWLDYNADFRAQSNYVGYSAYPYGDPSCLENSQDRFTILRGKDNETFHERWRQARKRSRGYSDPAHPFGHQGSADLNLYKLFLEQVHALLRNGGRLGFVVPSGLYSDHGTAGLRRLFLDDCRWEWLFGFENREKIFDIDSRFKFNPVIIEKGGSTAAICTAFMRRKLEDWERGEDIATPYSRAQVERFSPRSLAILEIQSKRDLEILEKIYANSVLLGDEGPNGWGIKYSTEFHMTNDSKLFPPRSWWEERGYRPDEYSRWLKGDWRPIAELWAELGIDPAKVKPAYIEFEDWLFDTAASPEERQARAQFVHGHLLKPGDVQRTAWRLHCAQPPYDSLPTPRADIPAGIILSRNADAWIREDKIEDTALPLYQGLMFYDRRPNVAQHLHGSGRRAKWNNNLEPGAPLQPQFLLSKHDYESSEKVSLRGTKVGIRSLSNATNERTVVAGVISNLPAGHSVNYLTPGAIHLRGPCFLLLSSFSFDWQARIRIAGTNITFHFLAEMGLPKMIQDIKSWLRELPGLGLAAPGQAATQLEWNACSLPLARHERVRLGVITDAIIALAYGMSLEDLKYIMKDCDHPAPHGTSNGFWRVDQGKDPELRYTILTLLALHDLEKAILECDGDLKKGITAFLTQNNGEGWMIPEAVLLEDYGLGHDERAKHPQPVASRLGPRFYDWQLAQSSEESWRECHLHARSLLGDTDYKKLIEEISQEKTEIGYSKTVMSEGNRAKKVAELPGPLFSTKRDKE